MFNIKTLSLAIALIFTVFACKKSTVSPNTSTKTNQSDTTNVVISKNDTLIIDTLSAKLISFDCSNVIVKGTIIAMQSASYVSFKLSYSGGNGKEFPIQTINSTGIKGLQAVLSAGKLQNGTGILIYNIIGIPETSGLAMFELVWGDVSCNVNVQVIKYQPISGCGETLKDVEGNIYKTVYIGTQQWMAENLRVSKYNDGTNLVNVQNDNSWWNSLKGSWCNYLNDSGNDTIYGKLYNWYVMDKTYNGNRNVCPVGWHIPTESEWRKLLVALGGYAQAGGNMKENSSNYWSQPNKGATNSSLFRALPSGFRFNNGSFSSLSNSAVWWTSTEFDICNYKVFYLVYNSGDLSNGDNDKRTGNAIRCIKD